MAQIPRDESPDSTLALLSEGYLFIPNRCRRYGSDIFETRLMLQRAVCISGEEAVRAFYEGERFTRKRALPMTALKLLQDRGSVQLLDGEAHRWRKRMLMSLMTPGALHRIVEAADEQWRAALGRWEGRERVVLLPAVQELFCRAVCAWAGVPLAEGEAERRTEEFAAMIDGAGAVGPRNWRGQLLRARTERWARDLVRRVREGELHPPEESALHAIAWHRDPDGRPLHTRYAAVELINVLRPTVAVAHYVTFAALALHDHPGYGARLRAGEEGLLEAFAQEVRRFYPFFPAVGGRVKEAFEWRGHRFSPGDWVLLDLYGTAHDARTWPEPGTFRPERFLAWEGDPYSFAPQGGGDHFTDHRCAGEWITIELLKAAIARLATGMRYEVPEQDLGIDLSRMPAVPESRFVIRRVGRT